MSARYINSDHLTPAEVRAGLASGELRLWRYGANGTAWYERAGVDMPPTIYGISPTDEQTQLDAESAQAALDLEIAEQELAAARERFAAFLARDYGGEGDDE